MTGLRGRNEVGQPLGLNHAFQHSGRGALYGLLARHGQVLHLAGQAAKQLGNACEIKGHLVLGQLEPWGFFGEFDEGLVSHLDYLDLYKSKPRSHHVNLHPQAVGGLNHGLHPLQRRSKERSAPIPSRRPC